MAQFEYWMTTDLKRGSAQTHVLHGQTFSHDAKANRIGVIVLDGGSPAELEGTVEGYIIQSNGATVGPITGAIEAPNKAYIDLTGNAYDVAGQISGVIRIVTGSGNNVMRTVLGAFTAYVTRTMTDQIVIPGASSASSVDVLMAKIAQLDAALDEVPAAVSNANNAAKYVATSESATTASKAYAAGDSLIYNGTLYHVTAPIASGGTIVISGSGANVTPAPNGVSGDIADLKSAFDDSQKNIYINDSLFNGISFGETDLNWTVGFISVSTGVLRPGLPNGSIYMIYSDLLKSEKNIELKALDGFAVRFFVYNKTTEEYVNAIGNQTPPYSVTLTPDYAYRIQYAVISGATQEQAETAIAEISTHIKITANVYDAPITPEKLESIGVVIDHQITWGVGYVNSTTGEFVSGGSTGGNYHVVSDLIDSDTAFNLKSTRNARWFRYSKSGVYDNGVAWQTAPVDMAFSGEYIWRIQILGESTSSGAQTIANNISDYVTIEFIKESDIGWITFLPITDVYIGDVQQRIYFNELARYDELVGYFVVSVTGATYPEVTYTDRYIEFNVTAAKTVTLTITYYYRDFPAATKTLMAHCKVAALPNKKIMFLGDSYTQNGGMVKWFKDHNANVTLYGTRSTTLDGVTYQHEGRGGWTAGNYLQSASKSGVANPFYNPNKEGDNKFDFAYYMANAGSDFTDVEIVNILLGRNSGFPVRNMDSLDIIVSSIKAYNPNIMVVLMCDSNLAADNSGAGAYLQNVHTANKQSHIYNAAFYEKYKNSTDVVMCFANLNLDNVYDFETEQVDSSITNDVKVTRYVDNVHPWNIPGLGKFGIALNGLLRNILND